MLQLYINNVQADLFEDTSVSLKFKNPFFENDFIPTSHTLSFDIPATPRNLELLGNLNRAIATGDLFVDKAAAISCDGVVLLRGELEINSVTRSVIAVQLLSSPLPSDLDKKLCTLPLPQIDFGVVVRWWDNRIESWSYSFQDVFGSYNSFWINKNIAEFQDYVAAPVAVAEATPLSSTSCINNITSLGYMGDVIPAISAAYLISQIVGVTNIEHFTSSDFSKLVLVCNYYPTLVREFSGDRGVDRGCWDVDTDTLSVTFSPAQCLPDVTCAEFLVEYLKLIGATLYIVDGKVEITLNGDVLAGTSKEDWSGMLDKDYSVSFLPAESYRLSFSNSVSEEEASFVDAIERDSVEDMVRDSIDSTDDVALYSILETGQVFEAAKISIAGVESNHITYTLLKDAQLSSFGATDQDAADLGRQIFEVQSSFLNARCVVIGAPHTSTDVSLDSEDPRRSGFRYYVCPELEAPESGVRPQDMTIGLYCGMSRAQRDGDLFYPQIKAIDDSLYEHHYAVEQWAGTYRRVVKGTVRLSPFQISTLDFRDKVHFEGRNYLVNSLSVSVVKNGIRTCEVEMVEV